MWQQKKWRITKYLTMAESILIVDDDKICNFITLNAFKKAGLKNVFVAVNVDDALKLRKLKNSQI